jgi:hypothetical protein
MAKKDEPKKEEASKLTPPDREASIKARLESYKKQDKK